MNVLRKLLLPIVPIYYLITWFRNRMYDLGIKKSTSYEFPVIAVGNLSVGGTGKSPMVEYLIRLLKDHTRIATLSRGYKRKTKGFQIVKTSSEAVDVGDEPLQFKTKFEDVLVGVDADRRNGIHQLRSQDPQPELLILDDAYQHRKVKAGFYILLTPYYDLYSEDIVLPTGNLREPRSGAQRADIIIVTKCPASITEQERNTIEKKLNVLSHQSLFFTSIAYENTLVCAQGAQSVEKFQQLPFILVTGIANPGPLVNYYHELGLKFKHLNFPDHHNFTDKDLEKLKKCERIITTEKDYVRLSKQLDDTTELWYQPISVSFIVAQELFDQKILECIKK